MFFVFLPGKNLNLLKTVDILLFKYHGMWISSLQTCLLYVLASVSYLFLYFSYQNRFWVVFFFSFISHCARIHTSFWPIFYKLPCNECRNRFVFFSFWRVEILLRLRSWTKKLDEEALNLDETDYSIQSLWVNMSESNM